MLKIARKFFCFVACIAAASATAQSSDYQLQLENASPAYQYGASQNIAKEIAIKGKELNLNPRSAMTFTNLGAGDLYYALYSNMDIRAFNLATKQLLGNWPLSPYADAVLENAVAEHYQRYKSSVTFSNGEGANLNLIGCMGSHPLRYGDLDNDGSSELILLPQGRYGDLDFVVFSTSLHKTIFAARLSVIDSLDGAAEGSEIFREYGKPGDPQFPSLLALDASHMIEQLGTGMRAFAKLYFGDFDNDNRFDIVVWRKRYESRKISDATRGFEYKEELLVHYKLDNGEYKKQPTEAAVIEGWLASKNLTWKKGYPNTSECAGQTNQLIPEFHDPLLNDPDVLQ